MSNGWSVTELFRVLPGWARIPLAAMILVFVAFVGYVRYIQPAVNPDTLPMPLEEIMQLSEITRHAFDTPCKTMTLDEVGEARYFCEDDCLMSMIVWEGDEYPRIRIHPKRLKILKVEVAGVFYADQCDGRCLPPLKHPGPFKQYEVADKEDECVVWVWRKWDDGRTGEFGCLQWQRKNICEKVWIDEIPEWECCVH